MDKWLNEIVTVGGLTGTRREYIAHLVSECGWTMDEAVKIACHTKAEERPMCRRCGWAQGGQGSWNGRACKCGHSAPTFGALLRRPL